MTTQNYGSKRLVVGAHYGVRDWLAQRMTALLMALFTIALIVQVLMPGAMGYDKWAGIFSHQWMKALTFVTVLSLVVHAWVRPASWRHQGDLYWQRLNQRNGEVRQRCGHH